MSDFGWQLRMCDLSALGRWRLFRNKHTLLLFFLSSPVPCTIKLAIIMCVCLMVFGMCGAIWPSDIIGTVERDLELFG